MFWQNNEVCDIIGLAGTHKLIDFIVTTVDTLGIGKDQTYFLQKRNNRYPLVMESVAQGGHFIVQKHLQARKSGSSQIFTSQQTTYLSMYAGWETKNFLALDQTGQSHIAYTKFHLPRPVFHSPGQIFTRIGEQVSASFPACVWVRYFAWNFKGYLCNSTQNILHIHWKIPC